jgi:hypothetical protein
MRRYCWIFGAILAAGIVLAADGWAGRKTGTMTRMATVTSNYSSPVRVAAITVLYATPTTNTLTVSAIIKGATYVRGVNSLSNMASVVYVPANLWLEPKDSVVLSNATAVAATWLIDFTY